MLCNFNRFLSFVVNEKKTASCDAVHKTDRKEKEKNYGREN